jgi:hypothetical protein
VDRPPQAYVEWRKEGLLAGPRATPCNEEDALELAIVAILLKRLGPAHGRETYRQLMDELFSIGRRGQPAWVVCDIEKETSRLFDRASEALSDAANGRLVRLIDIGTEVGAVIKEFRKRTS